MASSLQRARRRVGWGALAFLAVVILYWWWPGLPVLWGPSASAEVKQAGRQLFEREWAVNDPLAHGDGLGPVFNAKSCVACHFQGGVGGGGTNQHNVTTFAALPSGSNKVHRSGLIHRFAIKPDVQESVDLARKLFPEIPPSTRVVDGCQIFTPGFDPLRTESINSTALFGSGWIDRISDRAITNNRMRKGWDKMWKEFGLDFNSVGTGRVRVLADGRIGRFGWQAQFATLREFVAAACANELGLGTPTMKQPKPLGNVLYPPSEPDLDRDQVHALVAFVDTLPKPVEMAPATESERRIAAHGKTMFMKVGCGLCHVPDLGGVDGIYSDLLLHDITDPLPTGGNGYGSQSPSAPPPPEGEPKPTEWRTPPLWGVADSAPYFHDGSVATLEDAILRHRGDAKRVSAAFRALDAADQRALVAFLQTLKAPPDAIPAKRNAMARAK